MAEMIVARVTLKLAWQLFAPMTANMLEQGDVSEEKMRQMLLSEFTKIHEHLNALRRKELVAAIAFLETGFEVLKKDQDTAKEEFKKARDAAQMAFGVVPEPHDKVLATKILVTSTMHEFNTNLDTSKSLCSKYLERMNTLPEVIRACELIFTPQKSLTNKFLSYSGKSKREDILQDVAEINKCVYDYFTEQLRTEMTPPPVIRFNSYHINPVTDMILKRKPVVVTEVEKHLSGYISVAMTTHYIFAALGQISGSNIVNDIIAIHISTGNITHLLGHEKIVLSICTNTKHLFSASYDKTILIWDTETLQPVKTLAEHKGSVRSICLSEEYLFSGSADTTVKVWSLENDFECVHTLQLPQAVVKVTCSRRKFLFCLNGIKNIEIWNVNNFTKLHSFDAKDQATNIIANDNYMFIPTKTKEGDSIEFWNLGSLQMVTTMKESGQNFMKSYNSPYFFCGNEKIKMFSTTSQRLIMEESVFVGGKIKYMWMRACQLYILYQDSNEKHYIIKY